MILTIVGTLAVLWLVWVVKKALHKQDFSNEWWLDHNRREANNIRAIDGPNYNWDEVKKYNGWEKQ